MNSYFKAIILIFGVGLGAYNFAFSKADEKKSAPKPLSFSQSADLLVKKYQSQEFDDYVNFNEKFIVMRHFNFPNIDLTKHKNKFTRSDFDSPKVLVDYKKEMKTIELSDSASSSFRKKRFNTVPDAQKRADQLKLKKQMYLEINGFTKEGYYRYFNKQLEEGAIRVNVCANVDLDKLGFFDVDSAAISYREKKKRIENEVDKLLASLDTNSYKVIDFDIPAGNFDCDAYLEVDRLALETLYNNQLVGSIVNPEIVLSSEIIFRVN
jgi:hypothetical protein